MSPSWLMSGLYIYIYISNPLRAYTVETALADASSLQSHTSCKWPYMEENKYQHSLCHSVTYATTADTPNTPKDSFYAGAFKQCMTLLRTAQILRIIPRSQTDAIYHSSIWCAEINGLSAANNVRNEYTWDFTTLPDIVTQCTIYRNITCSDAVV